MANIFDNLHNIENSSNLQLLSDRVADRSLRPDTSPICLFLGAGADISSGGITFSQFKRLSIEEILKEPTFSVTTPQEIDAKFQQLFSLNSLPADRALLIERLFRSMAELHPSDAYKLLVLLCEAGGIDAVITTNFDVMLESAETILGCDVFQVFAAGVARPYPTSLSPFYFRKKPYLKLHGDLNARSISHLTEQELREGPYDTLLIDLLGNILSTHDVIFAGYGGYDQALAEIVYNAAASSSHYIFWCNPAPPDSESPLYRKIKDRCRVVTSSFDQLVEALAQPVLQKPRYAYRKPTYIRRLFEWRIDHCNRTYLLDYGQRQIKNLDLIVRRPLVERSISSFLASDKPLAIVAGPSGFGKTTLGVRLHDSWQESVSRKVILLTSKSLANPEIELHLTERLGGLGPPAPLSAASLESWLREQRLQVLIFIDAINEYSTELNDCVRLLRNIIRLCYYLPERNSAIRILATIRQETWNSILPRLDLGALRQAIWSASEIADTVEAISIGPLTDDELRDAIDRMRSATSINIFFDSLSLLAIERLRDPFLLSAVAAGGEVSGLSGPTSMIYKSAYDAMLANNGAGVDPATLQDALARLALQALNSGSDQFRPVDILPDSIRGSLQRAAKDLGVLSETGDGYLRFRHDRLQEYFLSLGLSLGDAPPLGTIEQLKTYLAVTRHNAKARAAARMFFSADKGRRFKLVEEAMGVWRRGDAYLSESDKNILFFFASEVVYELTESNPPLATRYIRSGIHAAEKGEIDRAHLRTLVQSAASLPDDMAIPTLVLASSKAKDDLARTEADIYIVEKLLRRYLNARCPDIDMLTTSPYNIYFSEEDISPWRRMGRVLRFLSRVGPDNLHPLEYRAIVSAMGPAYAMATQQGWGIQDAKSFSEYYIENSDRLLFNATAKDFRDFFENPDRGNLLTVLRHLEAGGTLRTSDFEVLSPYIESMDFVLKPQNVEFSFCTLFFIISAANDLGRTIDIWEEKFSGFNDGTSASKIDFYQGILVYLHVLFDIPYDLRFAAYEERILRDWPTVLKCRPGLARGYSRGFRDEFDMNFEDGFGVIYPYGVLMPSRIRRAKEYHEYRRTFDSSREHPLPMYTKYLRSFLSSGKIEEAIQLLQGINEVIVGWPIEGLATLRDAIGYGDPIIHRAVVRVLAEAYNRHPSETLHFLRTSGGALGDDDLQEIKIRQDPRIGRRQVSQQEWSHIGHYILKNRDSFGKFMECMRLFIVTDNFEDAVTRILRSLSLM